MMSLWDALRMNMMISYQELVCTFPNGSLAKNLMFAQTTKGVLETGIYRGVVSIYLSQDI